MDTTYKEIMTRIRIDFSSETMQVKRKWGISSEVLKEKKKVNLEFYIQQKY